MKTPKTPSVVLATLALSGAAVLLSACEPAGDAAEVTDSTDAGGTEEAMPSDSSAQQAGSLKTELDARAAGFAERAPEAIQTLYADGIRAVVEAGVVENAKNVGDEAPGFTLQNQTGDSVSLSTLLEQGPVVLIWYRGGWCPYCNLTLAAYQQRLDEIRDLGATLVALTPELPDKSLSTAQKGELEFQVLSDVGNNVARDYGVVFELTEGVKANYEQAFGMSEYNGDDSGELPLAATYVIDRDGQIRWAFLDADYRNRAEPADVISALESLPDAADGG